MTVKVNEKDGAAVTLSEAQALALLEHQRLCRICSTLCRCCRRLLCCAAAEKLVEGFVRKGGCGA